eukprot:GGOE01045461.1.p2 GENE.GGOE01045461.1~~GGOE01045461.1.p2  ORF type:complete len:342 (+),score=77.75 GGOE01045461.1:2-1027(+)
MLGGAATLAQLLAADTEAEAPDVVLCTDMLDVAAFRGLVAQHLRPHTRFVLYMHENQLGYPWAENDRDVAKGRETTYAFINYLSALAADEVWFNSDFHLSSFLDQLPKLLRSFPQTPEKENDAHLLPTVEQIRQKSRVVSVGVNFHSLDANVCPKRCGAAPLVLWNHRWEHDKNPRAFFTALGRMADRGVPFEVCVLGQSTSHRPNTDFEEGRQRLGARIVHWGYAESSADYSKWLWQADVLLVTSQQEYFGVSVVEAMHCGCFPLLPRRLAYPEHFPTPEAMEQHMYASEEELLSKLEWVLRHVDEAREAGKRCAGYVARYSWDHMALVYDSQLACLAGT